MFIIFINDFCYDFNNQKKICLMMSWTLFDSIDKEKEYSYNISCPMILFSSIAFSLKQPAANIFFHISAVPGVHDSACSGPIYKMT